MKTLEFHAACIQGRQTSLRPVQRADSALIEKWLNDPRVMSYWAGLTETVSAADARDWAERFLGTESGLGAKVIEAADQPIGFIEVAWDEGDANYEHKAEIDVCIGVPGLWGRGLGTDAIVALLGWMFTEGGMLRVYLQPRAVNVRAVRAYEKAGFVKEGLARQGEVIDGVPYDTVLMAALRDEWLSSPPQQWKPSP